MVDVAIEPNKDEKKPGIAPPGTLLIIPPAPVHMAIQDVAKLNDETGGEDKRNKEYEVSIHTQFTYSPIATLS